VEAQLRISNLIVAGVLRLVYLVAGGGEIVDRAGSKYIINRATPNLNAAPDL